MIKRQETSETLAEIAAVTTSGQQQFLDFPRDTFNPALLQCPGQWGNASGWQRRQRQRQVRLRRLL